MSNKTIEGIDDVVSRINSHPEYSSRVHAEVDKALQKEAAKHSYTLESQGEVLGKRQCEQEERKALGHIKEGWRHLQKYNLSLASLAQLGHVIEPETHKTSYFRDEFVVFGPFIAPEPGKVANLVDNLLFRLQMEKVHPVIRAAEAHIELVRIHPYMDGNGRVARLVQNFYLHREGYPAAIIPSSERELYISLMRNTLKDRFAMKSYFGSPSNSESLLQEYFASKTLTSVQCLEDELQKRRRHTVVINKIVDGGMINSVLGMIRSHAKAHGKGAAVQSDRATTSRKDTKLSVIGDLGVEELREIMGRCGAKYGFTYDVYLRTD